jgi:hypothetical protein
MDCVPATALDAFAFIRLMKKFFVAAVFEEDVAALHSAGEQNPTHLLHESAD